MANLAQLDWKALAKEANVRALLEDLLEYYKGVYQGQRLALAVWFGRTPNSQEYNLLVLFTGPPMNKIAVSERQSLLWKTGSNESPFVNIWATSLTDFSAMLRGNQDDLRQYFDKPEVLYFDKDLLPGEILEKYRIITEPDELIKGWYVSEEQYQKLQPVRMMLAAHGHTRPEVGIVKTEQLPGLETCRGLVHVEVDQKWLPSSPEGITYHAFYKDSLDGRPGYFLLQGGAVYKIIKFEVIRSPKYSALVLEKRHDDRYPEVHLRAVYPSEQPAA